MQYAVGMQYTVGTQYAVGVSTKRSTHTVDFANMGGGCHAMMTKGMVFRYTWVYSKKDTMAHTHRLVVIS